MNTESSKKFEQSAALTPELPTPLAGRALRRVREKYGARADAGGSRRF